MVSNKEPERAELHRTIWGIANDLRGSVLRKAIDKIIEEIGE